MKEFVFSGCLFFSLAVLPFTISSSTKLYSESQATSARKVALQKQLDALKEEQEQAELLSRFAEREAYRVMPIDWAGYHRYLDLQDRATEKAEGIALQREQLEKELQSLSK